MNFFEKNAPRFIAPAVKNGQIVEEKFSLAQYRNHKYVVLFFYPMDFTLIFLKEILRFQDYLAEFQNRDAVVAGCSIDSENTHLEWLQTHRENGGIEGVSYTLIADVSKSIARKFGVLTDSFLSKNKEMSEFKEELMPRRSIFIIDKEGIIRHELTGEDCYTQCVKKTLDHLDVIIRYDKYGKLSTSN
jgi:peroxiredoxin 2/4